MSGHDILTWLAVAGERTSRGVEITPKSAGWLIDRPPEALRD